MMNMCNNIYAFKLERHFSCQLYVHLYFTSYFLLCFYSQIWWDWELILYVVVWTVLIILIVTETSINIVEKQLISTSKQQFLWHCFQQRYNCYVFKRRKYSMHISFCKLFTFSYSKYLFLILCFRETCFRTQLKYRDPSWHVRLTTQYMIRVIKVYGEGKLMIIFDSVEQCGNASFH